MRPGCDKCEKSSLVRGIVYAMAAVPLLALAACGDQNTSHETIRPVKAIVVQPAIKERTLLYSGVLAPRIEATLGFRVSGKIVERFVNVGDRVRTGDSIARLDEKDLKLAENSARANVTAAKTRLSVARDAFARGDALLPNGFIAKSAQDQRRLELDSAQSAFDAAQDQLNQAINATGYALLTADKDGIVTSVRAEPGQVVSAGQAVITLAQTGDIEVSVAIPEQEIALLKVGDPAEVALWSAQDTRVPGKIREIAGAADTASRTYAIRVSIPQATSTMRLGMTASVLFHLPQDASEIALPLAAFTTANGKTFAFVANKDSETVTQREIRVSGITVEGAKVSAGINPGDIVVTGGVQFLHDGMKVRLPKELLTAVAANDAANR